jgi:hypothetical protein
MSMTPEQAHARAQKAARNRWHGDSAGAAAAAAELERANDHAAIDRQIDALVARAPRMTPEQAERIGRLFKYGPAPESSTAG